MPSAIFPRKATGHALIQHEFSAKCHQCVSANDPRLFLMVPLDILTKCHHKIWKCHQPLFYGPRQCHALFQHQLLSQMPGCFCKWSQIFLIVPKDILPQDLKMPSQYSTSHVIKGHQCFNTLPQVYFIKMFSHTFVMVPLDTQPKCHHKIWKCHQPFFHKPLQVMPDSTSVFSQMTSVCFCKWSQTFFNGASRHPDKMPPQDLKMPSAIFPQTSYKSCPYSTSVFSQMPSVCFCKWSQTFFNGASRHPDKMPPQDLKMPSAISPQTTNSHALNFYIGFQPNDIDVFLQMIPDSF